jgi:hypothetical protein
MIREKEAREEEVAAEIAHIKLQAENAMRNLTTARSIEEGVYAPHSMYAKLNSYNRSRSAGVSPGKAPKRAQTKLTGSVRSPVGKRSTAAASNKENVGSAVSPLTSPRAKRATGSEDPGETDAAPKYTGVLSPAAFNNLALQLEQALAREEAMKRSINNLVEQSAA